MRWAPEVLLYLRTRVRRNRFGDYWSLRDASREMVRVNGREMEPSRLGGYEKGDHFPRADTVAALADLFVVPVDVFFVDKTGPLTDAEIRAMLIDRRVILT